jgi:hypothetical protein
VFIDPKLGGARFGEEREKWISRHPGTESTKAAYRNILHAHVGPVLGDRTLTSVAHARDDVMDLLTVRLGEGSLSRRKIARALNPPPHMYMRVQLLYVYAYLLCRQGSGMLPSRREGSGAT